MKVQSNPAQLRKAMEQVSGKALEQLNDTEKSSALQQVAKDMGVKPVDLLTDLQTAFPDAFGGGPKNSLEQLGATAQYNASAGQISQQGRTMGTRLQAMAGGGIVANEQQIRGFLNSPDAASIRDKAGKHGEIMEGYAQMTAGQLKDEINIPPRVQTTVDKELQSLAKQTAAMFSPEGFELKDNPELASKAIGQHSGYVAGELSRSLGVDEATTRGALIDYFEGGGKDINTLIDKAGLPGSDNKDFWNNNGWMFSGGFGDKGDWQDWGGFGAMDQALNRPGVFAGEATLKVAEALEKGNGGELMASMLTKDPSEWTPNENIVGNFALRAAQMGWLASKTGRGIVEAHNPKKEDRSVKCFAPANDLVTDFNSMREAKGWNEVVKDLDQIKSFAKSSGILTPQGNPANASYYQQIDGKNFDRQLLHGFEQAQAGPRDGRVSGQDIQDFVRPQVMDGTKVTDTEIATLEYAENNFNLTGKGLEELQGLKLEAKLSKADEFGAHSALRLPESRGPMGQTSGEPFGVVARTSYEDGSVNFSFSDSNTFGSSKSDYELSVDGKAVDLKSSKTTIPEHYFQHGGETVHTQSTQMKFDLGEHLIELKNKRTGETSMFKVSVPEVLGHEALDFGKGMDTISSAQKFIVPVPKMQGEPLVYPDGHKDAGKPIADWRGDPIGDEGLVFFNDKDGSVQAVPTDGECVIILNQVTEEQGKELLKAFGDPSQIDLDGLKSALGEARKMGIGDQYNSSRKFIGDKMNAVQSADTGTDCFGLHKRDDRDICQAVFVDGAGAFQGPPGQDGAKKPPQYFTDGAVILQQGPEVRLIQPDIFAETYRQSDGTPVNLEDIPRQTLE